MKWTYHVAQKMKIAISMAFVILLILTTNFLSKQHFSKLQESFTSVYKDRLMAEIYIYNMTMLLNEKRRMLEFSENFDISEQLSINDSIQSIIHAYEKTFLTPEESTYFRELNDAISAMLHAETQWSTSDPPIKGDLEPRYQEVQFHLSELSEVQRKEGKRMIEESQKIVASSQLTLQFELIILIVIGVVIQILIFSAKPITPTFRQHTHLN